MNAERRRILRVNMCNAFSGVILRSGKVYWKTGMDSHNDIVEKFKLKDDKIGKLIPFEIAPANKDYISHDKWVFRFDDECPDWWKQSHENACWSAFKKWKKDVYSKIRLKEARNLIHPFKIKAPKQITSKHIKLLAEWASVRDSVRASVRASVGDSVGDSVWASVRDSVWASVRDSVRDSVGDSVWASVWASVRDSVRASVRASVGDSVGDSVWAYTGSLFKLSKNQWKYTSRIKTTEYPFLPVVKLWKMGLVPSFDGTTWRLHGGKKAKVLFEISKKKLEDFNGKDSK